MDKSHVIFALSALLDLGWVWQERLAHSWWFPCTTGKREYIEEGSALRKPTGNQQCHPTQSHLETVPHRGLYLLLRYVHAFAV